MRIRKGEIILSDEDIDRLVIHKLKQIEEVFENHYEEVANRQYDISSLTFFNSSAGEMPTPNAELDSIEIFIKEYFRDLKSDKRTHVSVIKEIGRIEKSEIPIISNKINPAEWVAKTKTAFKGINKYILDKSECIAEDIEFNKSINPRVKRCLKAIDTQKNDKALSAGAQTPWKKIFKEFARHKSNHKGTKENTIIQNRVCLETIFEIIGKEYIENITYKDCQKVCDNIYNVPKKWKEKYKNKPLKEILEQDNPDKISITSVKKYLRAFKEFMLFCKQRHYITESFNDDVLIPKRKESVKVDGFTKDELKLIFNPSFYPSKNNIYHPCRYWVPLVALYTGTRLERLWECYLDRDIDKAKYELEKQKYLEQKKDLNARVEKYSDISNGLKENIGKAIDFAANLSNLMKAASPDEKNMLLKRLLTNCVLDGEVLKYEIKAPFDKLLVCSNYKKWKDITIENLEEFENLN